MHLTSAQDYLNHLSQRVAKQIGVELCQEDPALTIQKCFEDHAVKTKYINFQRFYFDTKQRQQPNYFNTFKGKYALQGGDMKFLDTLNQNFSHIQQLAKEDKVMELYFSYFDHVSVKHGERSIEKNFGSFFTKLCHTLVPDRYTPMDNPMRMHFGLNNESFPIAMLAVSEGFRIWCNANRNQAENLKTLLAAGIMVAINENITKANITDMKLLDTIYWSIANTKVPPRPPKSSAASLV